ncbi:MAG: haloacid dehalogenase type II [Candidatus Binataceae bacterium]|nr:haloacid dehalogenase type II [Candidatus Binataceae bacterium]
MDTNRQRGIAFDVYGTLVDPLGIGAHLRRWVGAAADQVARVWREKQLEYTWRRALMGAYAPFSICTVQALAYAFVQAGATLTPDAQADLMTAYRALPPFADAAAGLAQIRLAGYRMVAFSNGEAAAVRAVLSAAGLMEYLDDVVSVDEIGSFKPDRAVYHHMVKRMGLAADRIWMVSSNPFDVIGAKAAGLRVAWVRRRPDAQFDPWDVAPDLIVEHLGALAVALIAGRG